MKPADSRASTASTSTPACCAASTYDSSPGRLTRRIQRAPNRASFCGSGSPLGLAGSTLMPFIHPLVAPAHDSLRLDAARIEIHADTGRFGQPDYAINRLQRSLQEEL